MTPAWSVRCACGFDPDVTFDEHFDAVEAIVTHLQRSGCGTNDSDIYKPDEGGDDGGG